MEWNAEELRIMSASIYIFFSLGLLLTIVVIFKRRRSHVLCQNHENPNNLSRVKKTIKNLRLARAQMSNSMFREFAQLLSKALRIYVLMAYKIPSTQITSEEIITRLMSDASNDWVTISLLAEVLRLTDSVKYSQRKISVPQQRGIYKKACRFVCLSERFFRKRP
jgi:hypothetical protein